MRGLGLLLLLSLSCRLAGFGVDVKASCVDGERTCATLNNEQPTGDPCKVWDCVNDRCEIVTKDSNGDGAADPGCEGQQGGATCTVSQEYLWPLRLPGQSDELPGQVSFASRFNQGKLMLAAMFYVEEDGGDQLSVATWSQVDSPPDRHDSIATKKVAPQGGIGDFEETWNYDSLFPILTNDSLGLIFVQTGYNDYRAGLFGENPVAANIHQTFACECDDECPNRCAGVDVGQASAAWTEKGVLVAGIKKNCSVGKCWKPKGSDNDLEPSDLQSNDVFAHLLQENLHHVFEPAAISQEMYQDHVSVHQASEAAPVPAVVGLPQGSWLIAHVDQTNTAIRMHVVTVNGVTPAPVQVAEVTEQDNISQLSLAIGRLTDDSEPSALLSYVSQSLVHIKLFALKDEPLRAEQIASIEAPAPTEGIVMGEPFSVYHTQRKEWLIAWTHKVKLTQAFGILRIEADGDVIPSSHTTLLGREGRILPHGIQISHANPGYVFVSYAIDDAAPVLLTGYLECATAP